MAITLNSLDATLHSIAAVQSGTWDIGTVGTITNAVTVVDGGGSITVDGTVLIDSTTPVDVAVVGTVQTTPAAYSTWQVAAVSVTSTATQIGATPLSNRLRAVIQNLGSQDVYVGPTNGVTTSTGLLISKGFSQEIMLDDDATLYAITASGSADVRFAEYAD